MNRYPFAPGTIDSASRNRRDGLRRLLPLLVYLVVVAAALALSMGYVSTLTGWLP